MPKLPFTQPAVSPPRAPVAAPAANGTITTTTAAAAAAAAAKTNSLESPTTDKAQVRRTSLSKANQKFQQLFSTSPKNKGSDAVALQNALAAQHAYNNPGSLSLPTINLSSATGEKAKPDDKPLTLFQPPSPMEARRLAKQHAEFGPLGSTQHMYSSRFTGGELPDPIEDEPPYFYYLTTYISYLLLIIFGHVRDFFGKRFREEKYRHLREMDGYAPLNSDFDNFYVRRLKMRINDCFARPVTGVPGRFITLLDRVPTDSLANFQLTGTHTDTLNMSSYNYLGFAQSEGPCADAVEAGLKRYGASFASPRADVGTSELAVELEDMVAKFVGKESAMIFGMGFGTNSGAFPALIGKGSLIISDELNHSSIRFGSRLSGAMVQIFKHNDMKDLEQLLREVISQGQPKTHRPWKRIMVTVEGLYSMEGTMCNLPGLLRLKEKYKFLLYVDEAHSIGALGPQGKGVCDYYGIDPSRIDILMGTFTKAFGANGGYLAADKGIIDKLRVTNAGTLYGESPSPAVLIQIISALRIINGELCPGQGEERLQRLAFNSRYLRLGLKRLGFIVYGHDDSPIIPLMLYNPAKMPAFSHEMLRRKISVVVVGYPATPLVSSRARFCVSAAHTKDDLDRMLEACNEVGEVLQLKMSSGVAGGHEPAAAGQLPQEEADVSHSKVTQAMMRASGVAIDGHSMGAANGNKNSSPTVGVRRRQAFEEHRPASAGTSKTIANGSAVKGSSKAKHSSAPDYKPPRWRLQDVIARGVQDVQSPLT